MTEANPREILRLLGEPLRWQLVSELGRSDRRVGELVQLLGKPQNVISYHLAELRNAGVATARRSSADGRDVYYGADLFHCQNLLGAVSQTLHPALELAAVPRGDLVNRGTRRRLLFLCTGNSARSQIAEGLVEIRSGGSVEARSAGSHPKPLHPNAVRVMADRGIDIAGRPTKPLTRFSRSRFDRVITLCDKVREICPDFPAAPATAHWSIPDPARAGGTDEDTYPVFEQVADEIERRVALLLSDLDTRPFERTNHG